MTRDSDDDLRKVLPDLATLNREADPTRRRAKLQDAIDNPQVDAALVLMRPGLKAGEDPLYYQVPRRAEGEAPPGPSPWEAARRDVPAEALPSSHAPGAAAPPVTVAHPLPEAQRPQSAIRRSAPIAILAVFVPLLLMWYLFVRPRTPVVQGAPREAASSASAVSAAPPVPPVPASVATPPSSAAVPTPSPSVPLATGDAGAASSAPVVPAPKYTGQRPSAPKSGSAPDDNSDPDLVQ